MCQFVQNIGHHGQPGGIAILVLEVSKVSGDKVEPLGEPHRHQPADVRITCQQCLAISREAQQAGGSSLDRRAIVGAQQYRDFADQCTRTIDGVHHHITLAYLECTADQNPDSASRTPFSHDNFAGRKTELWEMGGKCKHVLHETHRTRIAVDSHSHRNGERSAVSADGIAKALPIRYCILIHCARN